MPHAGERPSRILLVNPMGGIGGAERCLLDIIARIDRTRFDPVVMGPEGGLLAKAVGLCGVPFHPLRMDGHLEKLSLRGQRSRLGEGLAALPGIVRAVRGMTAQLRELEPALIHTNGNKAHVLGALAGRIRRIPVVWHVHDFIAGGYWERLLAYLSHYAASRVIANSGAVGARLGALRWTRSTSVVLNGVDLDRFHPAPPIAALRRSLNARTDQVLVGLVGILAPWKGQEVFLEAVAAIRDDLPQARFAIIGGEFYATAGHGEFRGRLEERVKAAGLGDIVTFTGHRDDVPEIMAALDVVVHASVRPEAFGLVILEAMACGRPVVATNAGGVPEVAGADGSAAVLVPLGNSGALASALRALILDPERRHKMGVAGRQRAEGAFDVRRFVAEIERVYEDLLRPNSRDRSSTAEPVL